MLTEGLGKVKNLVLVFQCCRFFAECVDTPQNHSAQADGAASRLAAELGLWGWALLATKAVNRPCSFLHPCVFWESKSYVLLKNIIRYNKLRGPPRSLTLVKWLETFEWNLFSTTAKRGVWTECRDKHRKAQKVWGQYLCGGKGRGFWQGVHSLRRDL